MTESGPPPEAVQLRQIITGKMVSMLVDSVTTLDVPTQLKDGPLTSDELAKRVGAHPDRLYRAMRALTTVNIFEESDNQTFSLTPMGQLLRADHPHSMKGLACWLAGPLHTRAWCELTHSIRTGEIAWEKAYGMDIFTHFETRPADRQIFQAAMTSFTGMSPSITASTNWSQFSRICDIGGGLGILLEAILRSAPTSKGVLFELPQVAREAEERFKGVSEMNGRVEVLSGDFFATCPTGCDAYTMKLIIHDHNDEKCISILKHCREGLLATEAGKQHGRVFVIDHVVAEPGVPDFAKILDCEMFAVLTGRERTRAQFAELFKAAGLELVSAKPTASQFYVIEAKVVQ